MSDVAFQDITYAVHDTAAVITINRPERYNACLLYTSRCV